MRVVIGCLALIGLVAVLLVGGCIGLIGIGVASAVQDIPSYATREELERRHAADLAHIRDALGRGSFAGLAGQVSDEVLAIYRDRAEVLKRHDISGRSHTVFNGGGVGSLRIQGMAHACEVVAVTSGGHDCLV